MRIALTALLLLAFGASPALAGGQMKQSPLLAHKAGAACKAGHRGPQRGAGYGYRLGGCLPGGR